MGIIGTAMNLPLPVAGNTASPLWATQLSAFLAEAATRVSTPLDGPSIVTSMAEMRHATRNVELAATWGQAVAGSTLVGATVKTWTVNPTFPVEWALPVERNSRLVAVAATGTANGAGRTLTLTIWRVHTSTGTRSQIATASITNLASFTTFTATCSEVIAAGAFYSVELTALVGACSVGCVICSFDRVASS